MIFVTIGTTKYPFKRPLIQLENFLKNNSWFDNEVIVQAGHTKFQSSIMQVYDFFNRKAFQSYYEKADFIISHGGTGSIMQGLYLNKKVLAVPRLEKHDEHIDNHQLEICKKLGSEKHIMVWNEKDSISKLLRKIKTFEPEPYKKKEGKIIERIDKFINNI